MTWTVLTLSGPIYTNHNKNLQTFQVHLFVLQVLECIAKKGNILAIFSWFSVGPVSSICGTSVLLTDDLTLVSIVTRPV